MSEIEDLQEGIEFDQEDGSND